MNAEKSKSSMLKLLIYRLVNKVHVLDIDNCSVSIHNEKYNVSDLALAAIEACEKNREELEKLKEKNIKIEEFVNLIDYARILYDMLFNGDSSINDNVLKTNRKKFTTAIEMHQTFMYANIEKIWSLFVNVFVNEKIINIFKKYSSIDTKNFGIFELRFLINNIYAVEPNGESLKKLWNFFTKKEIWKWFNTLRQSRNETMHANFISFNITDEELKNKYSNTICSFLIFAYVLEKIIRVFLYSKNDMEKFIPINFTHITSEIDEKKILYTIENDDDEANEEIVVKYKCLFDILINEWQHINRRTNNNKEFVELVNSLNGFVKNGSDLKEYELILFLKYVKKLNLVMINNLEDICVLLRHAAVDKRMQNIEKRVFFDIIKKPIRQSFLKNYNFIYKNIFK